MLHSACSKVYGELDKLRRGLLSKEEVVFDWKPTLITKNGKTRPFAAGEVRSRERTKGEAAQPSAEEIRQRPYGSTQTSEQSQE